MRHKLLDVVFEKNPSSSVIRKLIQGISEDACEKEGMPPIEPFAFLIRDDERNLIAGVAGAQFFGSLYIDQLWVDKTERTEGLGSDLMKRCEEFAREKNCSFITLNTMDFQALSFYQKLGFFVEFQSRGYTHGSICFYLRKNL
ncbi:MAG: hypothetical protein A2Y28_04440 [Chlamydiae bacterium GWC2_50_10]|nr:MAG: hypothetical protein A2Y28_04440 [Chlamydiae bacterium GWC2_50_10]OGN53953.1 MAG: hypothetical protein A2098_03560 [Chlamydiae bacterium GWF2_49_8]OGN58245.1 MAG: hypothetical protein A3D18_04175 [Chlamydiae bacterium RIFCSPHIGHO2_02_FULL_49_29]OGN62599.1 MAG: hypothetical protein A3E26_04780 [Chlamydiae bacterium RIFCSPHIGHO2_12_FULL_49_32]OGN75065.1 MAG: hypothetical protein A3G30_00640 [Chlamydiae bacterium RIFCSPLOWO2_12_FULL_49_12]HAZ15197.1 GNAT family N-acetyltransferase [Parach